MKMYKFEMLTLSWWAMAIILQFVPLNWLYWHMHQKHPAAALGMCIVKKRHYQEVTVKYLAESLTYNHTFPEWKIFIAVIRLVILPMPLKATNVCLSIVSLSNSSQNPLRIPSESSQNPLRILSESSKNPLRILSQCSQNPPRIL